MTKKKSGFLTFCFSLVPGAGEMYMGFMKQGVSIMAFFWLLIFLAAFLNMGPVLFILPILWCYSFFNVHNLRGLCDEEFYAMEDDYLFHLDRVLPADRWNKRRNNLLAWVLIVIGAVILWGNVTEYMRWMFPGEIYWSIVDAVPQLAISFFFIWGGINLIRGKKRELEDKSLEQEER
ncbi:MAG: hypothetical protein HFI69_12090 [Lachnospiraceae bacterium]|nr:hypothetical protein [Lachnospiraceae bacterium]